MKERQSHMSMVARFAYIFATIVTIFAQMGAAAPAMIVSADFDPNTLSVTSDISTVKKGDELTVSVSGDDAPRRTHWFNLGWVGDGLTFDSAATSAQAGYSSAYTFTEQNPGGSRHNIDVEVHNDNMSWPIKFIFKVGDVSGQAIKFLSMDYNAWPSTQAAIDAATALTINTNGAGSSTSTTTTPSKPLTSSDLTLSQVTPKTAYDPATTIDTIFHADLTNYPTQYRDVQFKIKETADGTDTNTAATFDPDATATLAKSNGFTVSGPVDSEDHTVYSYTNNGMYDYKIWLFKDNSIRIEYPKGTTGSKGGYIAFKANTQATKVTLTPVYVGSTAANDTPAELVSGSATSFGINAPKEIDGTTLSMNPVYAAPFDYGNPAPAYLSNFPFFYIKDEDTASGKTWYSFDAYTNYTTAGGTTDLSKNDLLKLRAGIVAGLPFSQYNVTAASSNSTRSNAFENLHQIAADGSFVAGTEKKLTAGKIYTLYQYNPLSKTSPSRYKRLSTAFASHYWYMPDGIPTFSVGSDGKITLHDLDKAAGNSIKGAWDVDSTGKQIINRFFHVKYIRVVDQNGDPVPNATLTMNNTTEGDTATMTGSTDKDGANGELLPDDYVKADDGPFYYADGVESFKDLTLPAGYSKENMDFSSLTLDPATDYLKVDGATTNDDGNVTAKVTNSTTDDHFRTNQILTLTVHKYTSADTDVTIKKVDQSDITKVLGGATFKIAEQGNTTDPLNTTTKETDATTGLTTNSDIKQTSDTKTRVFKVTEDAVPSGYAKGNSDGYFATWVKGTGFTGVGDTATTATDKTSSDGLATVTNGQLQIADPSVTHPGGGDSKMKIQYVDTARYNDKTNKAGTTIAGAQLPVLNPGAKYGDTGLESFSGLGGIIYNPSTTTPIQQTADTMMNSTQVSGEDGYGIIQNLWSVDGLTSGWDKLITNTASAGWILRNAIATNTIPASPAIYYQLVSPDQKKYAAEGSAASGYYNLGSTLVISTDGKTLTAGNPTTAAKANTLNTDKYRDNPVRVDTATNTAIIQLYKVKQVKVVDTAGNPVPNATVTFTGMSAKTGDDGIAKLTPTDKTNIFPNARQYLQSVKQGDTNLIGADGAALTSDNNTKGFAFEIANGAASTDKISATVNTLAKDASISADGQTVQITTQAPTTIKIHKQSKTNSATPLAGAKFKVWTDSDSKAVTTSQATDADGNTSVTLANPDPNNKYHITEDTAPTGYTKDTKTYDFAWTAKDQVTGTTDTTNTVSATNGTLNFADMPDGSGNVGDNGSNGGTLTINKVNADTTSADTPPDGAQFTVKEITAGATGTLASGTDITTTNGKATLNLGSPTTTTRLFTITEKTAPTGYVKNTNTYTLKIDPTGTMSLGQGTDASKITNTTGTDDGAIKFVSTTNHAMNFADSKRTITIHKQDFANASTALPGATFTIAPNDDATATATGTTDASGNTTITLKKVDSNNKYIVTETAAPDKYVAASPVTVTLDADGKLATTSDSKATSIDKNVLTVKDVKKGSGGVGDNGTNGGTLTINKIDRATGTSLAGATFKVKEQLTGNYEGSSTTDSTGNATFNLGDPTTSDRMFTIYEDTAPSGYIANTNYYYLRITATGAMYFGDPNASGTPSLPTQTTDGNLKFASTTDHTIKFADQSASQPIKVKKTNASGTALQGATFQLSESDINGKPLTKGYSISQTTPTNGTVQFTPSVTDTAVHYYLLQETAAPTQYAIGASEVVVYQGGKVTGVKTLAGSSVEGSAGPLTKNADSTLTYVDQYKPMPNRTINVRRAVTDGDTPSLSIVNKAFKVTLQSASDPTKVYPIDIDATTGEGKVTATELATAMGYSSAPEPTKTDTFWLSIDPGESNYSVPVKRQVTFSWDREKGGFKVISTQNDNMVDDDSQDGAGQPNVKNKVGTGNLRMYLRRDTLVAQQDVADVNQEQHLVPNAQFTLNYINNGTTIATQNVKTNDFGVAVLQGPTAKDMTSADNTVFPVNQTVDVQLTQTNGTKIPGYQNFTKTAYLKYNSATGFTVPLTNATTGATQLELGAKVEAQFDPESGDEDPTTVPVSPDPDINVYAGLKYIDASSGVVGTQYAYAGTQLVVPLTQAPTAALTDAPQVMNFGKAQLSANDQTLSLIPSNDTTNAAAFDTSTLNEDAVADGTATDDQDTSGKATGFLNASVTQTGTLTGGWRLDMSMSDLTAQGGTDTVKTGSVSMAAPAVTLTPSSETNPDTKGMGIEAPTVKMNSMETAQSVANTGSNSAPGVYNIAWDMSGIKMHLPALSGKMNTNYHSTISWDLITAP